MPDLTPDLQALLDRVAEGAARSCGADDATVRLVEGDQLHLVAHFGPIEIGASDLTGFTEIHDRPGGMAQAVRERRSIHVADSSQIPPNANPALIEGSRELGIETRLATPMLLGDLPVGVIQIRRTEVRPFTDEQIAQLETYAALAAVAIDRARLTGELGEALEQKTATAEILKVISSSPSDLQAVLDTIIETAARLCGATRGNIHRAVGGDLYPVVASYNIEPEVETYYRTNPLRVDRASVTGRVLLEGRPVHVEDTLTDPERNLPPGNARTILGVPLLREAANIGVLVLMKDYVERFTQSQIELVQTFADHAVIAIENARLLTELRESLEQQTAMSEVLEIIASSPTDVQPVLDAICESAARVSESADVTIGLVEEDTLRIAARHGPGFTDFSPGSSRAIDETSVLGRSILAGATVQVEDTQGPDEIEPLRERAVALGVRTVMATPLIRDGVAIGAIGPARLEVHLYTEREIALFETFADQAVIAIENVRLFHELEERYAALREALEHQTATAEVLSIISRSPTDVQPVLDAICESAARVCGADDARLRIVEDDAWVLRATFGPNPIDRARVSVDEPQARWIAEKGVLHLPNVREQNEFPALRDNPIPGAFLGVRLLHEDKVLGGFIARRAEARPFTDSQIKLLQTFADQAVIALENVRLFQELQEKTREQAETLEEQAATNHILEIISQSPTDVQPVLDAIVESAARVVGTDDAVLRLVEGDANVTRAHVGPIERTLERVPLDTPQDHWTREHGTLHLPDALAQDVFPQLRDSFAGARTWLLAPLRHRGQLVGHLVLRRMEVQPFTDRQIKLIETFADQAVIAIENVRLFHELEERNAALREALEHQTATAEVLSIISRSPTDVQPVLDAIVESAARVCSVNDVVLRLIEGDFDVPRAHFGTLSAPKGPFSTDGPEFRYLAQHGTLHLPDVREQSEFQSLAASVLVRTYLAVPLKHRGELSGYLLFRRTEVRPFTDPQIKLLETFADQAVIAIENTRLFEELQQKTREQAETLEEQAATNHILEIISQSPTDVQPVLDAIAENAAQVCDARDAVIMLREGDLVTLGANFGPIPPMDMPRPVIDMPLVAQRVLRERATIHIPDVLAESGDPERAEPRELGTRLGFRSILITPLPREELVIGAIVVRRAEPLPFSDKQIALLESFASQAVIAIENVRLFHELEERNVALHEALEHQTATAEVLSIISRSPTDVQPVLDAICESAAQVCGAEEVAMRLARGDIAVLGAYFGPTNRVVEDVPIRPGGAAYRTIKLGETVHYQDMLNEGSDFGRRVSQEGMGRTALLVPLRGEAEGIGYLSARRLEVRPFSPAQIKLLETFADQAVIAIENVRLFEELEQRNADLTESLAQQTATAEVLEVMSAAPDQLQLVLDAVAERAARVCNATEATIYIEREGVLRHAARFGSPVTTVDEIPVEASRFTGQAFTEQRAIHVPDALAQTQYTAIREAAEQGGPRAYLTVPLVHEGRAQGVITARRVNPEPFSERQIELLKTFADQAAIAIAISGLIEEIRETNQQLEVASQHKSQFLANMSHELRTPLNAILGYTELITDAVYGEVPERIQEVLERVGANGRHLLGLINDVLDLSKMEAGQLILSLDEYALDDVVQTVATQVEPLAGEKHLALKVSLAPDLPVGKGDDRRIAQVLLNLLGNAIKFTEEGEVAVRTEVADGSFVISVSDTGAGIAEADREKIFEEFQQADSSNTRPQGGTGLGLSIARRIVEMHGGRIWVESVEGEGSTFAFSLPVRVEKQVVG